MKLRKYYWQAKNHQQTLRDIHIAGSTRQLRRLLKQRGLRHIKIAPIREPFRLTRASYWIPWLYEQLHCLIRAGMPLLPSLQQLQSMRRDAGWFYVLWAVIHSLQQGRALSDACQQLPRCFNKLDRQLLQAAELSGQLETTLAYLVAYRQRINSLKRNMVKALLYPCTVVVVSIVVCMIMLTFVVPKFAVLFTAAQQNLPAITQQLLNTADFLQHHGATLLLVLLAGIATMIWAYKRSPRYQIHWQQGLLTLPGIRSLCIAQQLATSCYTLGLLLQSGISIDRALQAVIDQQNWALNRRHWQQIADHLRQGQTLTQAIANQPIITDLAKQLIATGESSGQLPAMLTKIAQHHETEFTQRLQRFTQLLEPLSLVVIGGMVTLMMLALYIPLFELGNTF